jgi:hypothetical protein
MAGVTRLCVTNLVQAVASVLTASSALAASPVTRLRDQLRSKTWRSAVGWTVVAGVNDKLDFSDGTTRAATIAAGTYATGALMAAALQTAMNAVSTTCVVSYSGATFKFTISRTGTLSLLWSSGANATTNCGKDFGFSTAADQTGSSSYTAPNVAYQSRQWLKADFGSALGVQAGIVINHNSGAGGTYTLQGNASDAWTAPSLTQALAGDATIRVAFLGSLQTFRWWRLLIEDVQNPLGYSEVGIWYAGPYVQPTVTYAAGFAKRWNELSEVSVGISGAHFQDERPRQAAWALQWIEIPEADRATMAAAFALVPRGRNFFFAFDPVGTPTATEYVYLDQGAGEDHTVGTYYTVPAPAMLQAMG